MNKRAVTYRVEFKFNRKIEWHNIAFRTPTSLDDARELIEECRAEDGRQKNTYRIIEIARTETVVE